MNTIKNIQKVVTLLTTHNKLPVNKLYEHSELDELLKEGWKIKSISHGGVVMSGFYSTFLLEKPDVPSGKYSARD